MWRPEEQIDRSFDCVWTGTNGPSSPDAGYGDRIGFALWLKTTSLVSEEIETVLLAASWHENRKQTYEFLF